MPRPRYRSRKLKRVKKKVPGGATKLSYKKKTPKIHKCAECKKELKGIPRLKATKAKHVPKTKKKVSRLYGGFLCGTCARKKLKNQARLSK
ncbi:MAG: 50S ribosomal protein L34e [Nanoarchaeota archaeon]|nr:50S ribosomal protein L34e [Nanoarchaeota archaeon]MBU1321375.1 50S ribosomal protein L34e [Nanoarchaeota archaeon]MBU1597367.1 50S ribosomal protein L34e [Nanoarchaeota archaeon]MBU2441282.1 50S ribosomal protein L34e [Nanoarchaeota archaeon]